MGRCPAWLPVARHDELVVLPGSTSTAGTHGTARPVAGKAVAAREEGPVWVIYKLYVMVVITIVL